MDKFSYIKMSKFLIIERDHKEIENKSRNLDSYASQAANKKLIFRVDKELAIRKWQTSIKWNKR